jgi:dolichol-phosphate mannosyltransferase
LRKEQSLKTISYLFPVYNEPGLEVLYAEMKKITNSLKKKYKYEFIFINDGSKQRYLDDLKSIAKRDTAVRVLSFSRNFGHQAAVSAGLDNATGDAIIIMDSDMQDPPEVCLQLIKKWEEGYQIVYAQRRTRDDTLFKRWTAHAYYRILGAISSIDIPPDTGDFRLADRQVVKAVCDMKEYHRFLRGMFSYVGFSQIGVPFDRGARYAGESGYTLKKMIRLAKDGIFSFSDTPLRLVARAGYIVSAVSAVGIIYAIILRLFYSSITVPGWTMIVVSIFFMGGVQLIMLGVIGEYIGRIYNEVRHRPIYIIAEEITQAGIREI